MQKNTTDTVLCFEMKKRAVLVIHKQDTLCCILSPIAHGACVIGSCKHAEEQRWNFSDHNGKFRAIRCTTHLRELLTVTMDPFENILEFPDMVVSTIDRDGDLWLRYLLGKVLLPYVEDERNSHLTLGEGFTPLGNEMLAPRIEHGANVSIVFRAARFCRRVHENARHAIDEWSRVGMRIGVVKDVRILIAKLVWDDVDEWIKVST